MISFQTIRRGFTKLRGRLLALTFATFQFVCSTTAPALPTVISYGHFTDRVPPNPLPAYPDGADLVQVFAVIQSSDLVGSPTISAHAVQGDTTLSLDLIPPDGTIQDYNVFYKFIDLDPDLTGAWEIVPTDSTGIGPSTFINPIAEPEFLPFVENITLQGAPLGARVSWTLPHLDGFDVDEVVGVGIFEVTSGKRVFQSAPLALQTTSYQPPAGTLQFGVEYVYSIMLGDFEGPDLENLSRTFSVPFRYTIAGDFNTDGTIDAADYVTWRNGLGTIYTQNDYDVWRANFGKTAGGGEVLSSAEPLSATVPEPSMAVLVTFSIAPLCLARCRRRGQD